MTGDREQAILGSSNFTQRGLGLSSNPNIELNLIVDSDRDRADLKAWFDAIWDDENLVADVKEDVLSYLEQLYVNHPPRIHLLQDPLSRIRALSVRSGG